VRAARGLRCCGAAALTIVAAGYFSNAVTYSSCELDAGRHVVRIARGGQLHLVPTSYPGSEAVLAKLGIQMVRCPQWCWPAGGVQRARSVAPFVASVTWWASPAPGAGVTNTTRYLCVFGRAIAVSMRNEEKE
jgi:hypothetical protein